jgi:excisionase family DNA binding protein
MQTVNARTGHSEAHSALLASVNEFAVIVGVSRRTVYNLMRDKKLRSVCIAGRRLIPISEAHRFVSEAA